MIKNSRRSLSNFLFDNKVAVLFLLLGIISFIASGQNLDFLFRELFTRIGRNSFLVLSLIIPVLAGLGLNFGIVIGAIAAQIATFLVVYWNLTGLKAIILVLLISTPMAVLFGWMVGSLFNKMKGAEMIGGMVLGYFSDGLYQFLFLFVIGGLIKVNPKSPLIISGGIGVKNSIDLKDNIKYAIDTISIGSLIRFLFVIMAIYYVATFIYRKIKNQDMEMKSTLTKIIIAAVAFALTFVPALSNIFAINKILLLHALELVLVLAIISRVLNVISTLRKKEKVNWIKEAVIVVGCLVIYALTFIPALFKALVAVQLPIVTYLCIAALCLFNSLIMRTKFGQNMRTVGQNRTVANAAGINVDRTRVIAMIISTVLACWGQLISLQNIGTLSTYGAHTYIGQFTIAALLVGGASVHQATNKQALVGVVLFHTLFILSPLAGKELFGNAQIGEYFRVFVAYGVIAVALAMHAWTAIKDTDLPRPRGEQKTKTKTQS